MTLCAEAYNYAVETQVDQFDQALELSK